MWESRIFLGEEADVELEDMFESWPAEFTDTQDKAMQTKMPVVKVSQSGRWCEIEDDEDEEEDENKAAADEEDEINHGKIPLVRNSASEAWIITKGNVEDEGGNAKVSSIGDAPIPKAGQEDGKEAKVNEHKVAEQEEEGGGLYGTDADRTTFLSTVFPPPACCKGPSQQAAPPPDC